jgi:ABC-type multidrug transport system ATPase subunit
MRFLFRYDQVRQPIETLSGGERSRLQLLLLMLGGANCLVLDEPTNHLDIDSVEVLESALERFDGTIVVISHDRYFLDRIADRIVEVSDGSLLQYEGGYSAWRERKEGAVLSEESNYLCPVADCSASASSRVRLSPNSARAPKIWKTSLPPPLVVSRCSVSE